MRSRDGIPCLAGRPANGTHGVLGRYSLQLPKSESMQSLLSGALGRLRGSTAIVIFLVVQQARAAEFATKLVDFHLPDGPYTNSLLQEDFGNGAYSPGRGFAAIRDNTYQITFRRGFKVSSTGAAVQVRIPPGEQYTLSYQIRYDPLFESGLTGKQFGFEVGVGYDGGRGAAARANGDGGSVRIQFDSQGTLIYNRLYVYSCDMPGKFGYDPLGRSYAMSVGQWATIRMTLTMQHSQDSHDGRVEVWCNGSKEIDFGHLHLVNKDVGRVITRLSFESFPGGGGKVPLRDNFVYVRALQWSKGNLRP